MVAWFSLMFQDRVGSISALEYYLNEKKKKKKNEKYMHEKK